VRCPILLTGIQNHLKPHDPSELKWTFRSGNATVKHKVNIDDEEFELTCERIGSGAGPQEEERDEDEEIF
jgi:hypothetical protein